MTNRLDDLLRLATLIRQRKSENRTRRAEAYKPTYDDFDSDDDHDESNDGHATQAADDDDPLGIAYGKFADVVIRREIGPENFDSNQKDYMTKRLKTSMMKRWRRICYQHAHAKRLTGQIAPSRDARDKKRLQLAMILSQTATSTIQQENPFPVGSFQKTSIQKQLNIETYSQSAATTFPSDYSVAQAQNLRVPSSKAASRVHDIDVNLPRLPPALEKPNGYMYHCPYCSIPQEVTRPLDARGWK